MARVVTANPGGQLHPGDIAAAPELAGLAIPAKGRTGDLEDCSC